MKKIEIDKKKLLSNIKAIIEFDTPLVSNLSNASRVIMDSFENTSWCGFYLCDTIKEILYLGPYQGPLACTIIPYGKGVCGNSASLKKTQLVPNVHEYAGHIACSGSTNSEIVVPIIKDNIVVGVIDLDSDLFNNYTSEDVMILEDVASFISKLF